MVQKRMSVKVAKICSNFPADAEKFKNTQNI